MQLRFQNLREENQNVTYIFTDSFETLHFQRRVNE